MRKHFKRSRRLLIARRALLSEDDRATVDVILHFSERLYQAYALKKLSFQFMNAKSSSATAELLSQWFDGLMPTTLFSFPNLCLQTDTQEMEALYLNAFTEGCNNAIKALKCATFCFRHFSNSRARILQTANPASLNF